MQVMVSGCRVPVDPLTFDKPLRENLNAQMPVHITGNHVDQKNKQGYTMSWNRKNDNRKDGRLHNGFEGMKRIGGPGRGVSWSVVDQVHMPKYFWVVHQAVSPVKPRVMEQDH